MAIAPNVVLTDPFEHDPTPRPLHIQASVEATELNVGVLFDRLLDAVVVAALNTGRIVLWNPAAERLFGYPAREVIGKSIEILMPQPIALLHRAGLERYLRTGHGLIADAGVPVEVPARTRSGEDIRVELSLSELTNLRGERFALAVIRDAMHRKRLELTYLELVQARVARSEAQAELKARDALLEALAEKLCQRPDPAELQQLSQAIAEFRRLQGGQLKVRPRAADLVDFVHAAADAMRNRASGYKLLVDAPPNVFAVFDATSTRQVLDHVLQDAVEASTAGTRIQIRLQQPTRETAQMTVSTDPIASERELGLGVHFGRSLMQRQGGTLTTTLTASGGLEVVLTWPALPCPPGTSRRRRSLRAP